MTRLKNNHNAIDWRQELKSDPELFRGIIHQTVQEIGGKPRWTRRWEPARVSVPLAVAATGAATTAADLSPGWARSDSGC